MAQKKISVAESTSVVPQVQTPGARVLLAEDDRALRRFLQIILERAGYTVFPAADGLEAMKIALSSAVDILVTDAMMPNLSGHELCRFIRNSQTLAHLPVILLSALEQKEPNEGEQVDAFLSKPVAGEDLVSCIEKLLARQGANNPFHNEINLRLCRVPCGMAVPFRKRADKALREAEPRESLRRDTTVRQSVTARKTAEP
jgi:DNA-binding response OmpR family regulator